MSKVLREKGDVTELKFCVKATENNCVVSKPLMGYLRYDFIVDYYGELSRIQVKATDRDEYGYKVATSWGASKKPYTANEIDYFSIYIIRLDTWYLIPVDVIDNKKNIKVSPEKEDCKFAKYKENWNLIKPNRKYIIPRSKKKNHNIGGVYENRGKYSAPWRVKYRDIHRRFNDKSEAGAFLANLREKARSGD